MAGRSFGAVFRRIERIFAGGSIAGLSEGELLDRFAIRGDEAAFEAILARHGPMVLGICRRVLRDENDAEDAFQATFLVLVRKAGSLRHRDLLGNWLFGVASRVALRARGVAARRRTVVGPDIAEEPPAQGAEPGYDRESGAILHEELSRLPEKYRTVVLLCYLEGLTHEEAARQLGWPLGTVKGRLARARELLRKRLTRRGVVLSASAVSAAVARQAEAAVPAALVQATIKAALAVAAGQALAAGVVAVNVAALMKGASDAMFLNTLKLAVMVLVAGVLTTGAGVWAYQAPRSRARPETPAILPSPATAPGSAAVRSGREAIAVLAPQVAARDRTPKTRAILAKLQEPVSMSFANETPLADVLKYIQSATQGPNDTGVPIYLDPQALKEKKIDPAAAVVSMDLEGIPVSTTLRLALKQLDLAYCVKDGMVIISSVEGILQELKEAEAAEEAAGKLPPPPPAVKHEAEPAKSPPAESPPEAEFPAPANHQPNPGQDQSQLLEKALDAPVKLSIAKETPLGEVFKSLETVAVGPNGRPIPFYIDPDIGVREISAEFAMDGVPLRTVLSLLLSQVECRWDLQDGLLIVSTELGLQNYRRIAAHFSAQLGPASDGISPANVSPELQAKLDAPITLSYPKETPLDDVMKSIRDATKGAGTAGFSLFYESSVFVETEDTIGGPMFRSALAPDEEAKHWQKVGTKPVQIDVKDIPLRTCLALLLRQRGPLVFNKEGMGKSAWPPLDGRLIDGVLIIGTHDWVQNIQVPQGGMGRGPR
jgi:RNA polymerase sigma factor (sigma-70 family)